MKLFNTQYGLIGFGGITPVRLRIDFAGKCIPDWKTFYKKEPPYKKWFSNPIFQNRSGYDKDLNRYRIWFIFFWFIFDY